MKNKDISKVEWGTVLEGAVYIYNTASWKIKIRTWLQVILQLFIKLPNIKDDDRNVDYLFIKSMVRDDYDKLFYQIASCCPQDKLVEDIVYYRSGGIMRSGGLRPVRISMFPFQVFIKYSSFLLKYLEWNIFKSVFIMTHVLRCLEVYEYLEMNIKYKNLIVFADMQAIDNFLVQTAKIKGIPTVTLQHGLYIDYTEMENVNCINYKNHVADYFLAWGNSTKELIEKFNPDANVIICGKPLEEKETPIKKLDYFTVMFDQNLLSSYNQKLLDIAYEMQERTHLKVNIRFHPYNNEADYAIKNDGTYIGKELNASVFILAHTTSMIHELLRMGMPVFKLTSKVPALDVPEFLKFSTTDELEKAINQNDLQAHDFKEDGKEFISFIAEESLEKYQEFFSGL